MILSSIIIGMALLFLPQEGRAQLYTEILEQVRQEIAANAVEEEIAHFVAAVLQEKWQLRISDVHHIMNNTPATVCSAQCQHAEGIEPCRDHEQDFAIRPALTPTACSELEADVRTIVLREARVRSLGRTMQAIATGQEQPIKTLPGPLNIASNLEAIGAMWRSGTGGMRTSSAVRIRTQEFPTESIPVLRQVFAELEHLQVPTSNNRMLSDEYTAAIHRYTHGVRLVQGNRTPQFPPPFTPDANTFPEQHYRTKRWVALENTLQVLWQSLPKNPTAYVPRLATNDVIVFTLPRQIEDEISRQHPLVTLWARIEHPSSPRAYADVGLAWTMTLEPTLPNLVTDQYRQCLRACEGIATDSCAFECAEINATIPGGTYPPPASIENSAICTHPLGNLGYLCRNIVSTEEGRRCQEVVSPRNGQIVLAGCTTSAPRLSISGPASCDAGWHDNPDIEHVCKPGVTVSFANTIGNNLCYITDCLKYSLRTSRVTGGRSPFVSGESAFPWNRNDTSRIPGRLSFSPATTPLPRIPAYNPEQLVQIIEESLCGISGQAPLSPPSRCSADARRILAQAEGSVNDIAQQLLSHPLQIQAAQTQRSLGQALGTRVSTELYTEYLEGTLARFTGLMQRAALLLTESRSISFPTTLCPLTVPTNEIF